MIFERKKYLEELVGARINLIKNYFLQARFLLFDDLTQLAAYMRITL